MTKYDIDPEQVAEIAIFGWYTRCQEEHDQLSTEGLESLRVSIEAAVIEALQPAPMPTSKPKPKPRARARSKTR